MNDIAHNLAQVRDKISAAATRCGRSPEEITLLAVSKTKPASAIAEAIDAGQQGRRRQIGTAAENGRRESSDIINRSDLDLLSNRQRDCQVEVGGEVVVPLRFQPVTAIDSILGLADMVCRNVILRPTGIQIRYCLNGGRTGEMVVALRGVIESCPFQREWHIQHVKNPIAIGVQPANHGKGRIAAGVSLVGSAEQSGILVAGTAIHDTGGTLFRAAREDRIVGGVEILGVVIPTNGRVGTAA